MDESILSNGYYLTPEQLERIDKRLHWLHRDTNAIILVLAEITGQLIIEQGDAEMSAGVLAALAAGNMAATKEMASLVGESGHFKSLLHEGKNRRFLLSEVDNGLVLIVVFDNRVPLGLLCLNTRETVKELSKITAEARANPSIGSPALPVNLSSALADELDASLGYLFKS